VRECGVIKWSEREATRHSRRRAVAACIITLHYIANETRLATLAFRTARALLTTSFTAAASETLSVEFTEFGDRIAYSEDFTVGHLRSGQSRLRAYLVAY
jgi:hypothetical protein